VVGIAVEKSRSRGESPREGAVPDEDSFGCPRYYGGAASGLGGDILRLAIGNRTYSDPK
jgi:hypothetical protein